MLTKRLQTYRIVPFQAQITNPLAAELLRLISCTSSDQYAINHDTPGSREIETKVEAARLADDQYMEYVALRISRGRSGCDTK